MESPQLPRPPRLSRNWITLIGAAIALVSLANVLFLMFLDFFEIRGKPYMGVLTYMVFPAFLVLGLLVVPIGMLLERWRRRRREPGEVSALPRIDLNLASHRKLFGLFVLSTAFFLVLSSVGSYRAHQFSDSDKFCGQTCHTVMKPEFAAYQASPHARVPCVECHVGAGATWFVRSKLSGAYQVYAVASNSYPRPIPSPIKNLRPAQETCEQCHWPEKFWGAQLKVVNHFGSDEKNTPRQIRMLIKTGGGSPTTGLTAGIHWHMNIMNQVWYIARDPQRQEIPWVKVEDTQGRVTEYLSKDSKLTPDEIAKAEKRRMDCMDCHNRPSHVFLPPDRAVDNALLAGRIDQSLPFIKQQAVEVLSKPYPSTEAARRGIATDLDAFYFKNHAALYPRKVAAIKAAISEVQRLYETNVFPEMKVDWRTHPNNIGHFYYSGCFRCHDGQHVSQEGKTIAKECEICHTILGQDEGSKLTAEMRGRPFKHPVEIGDLGDVTCSSCHTGGPGP
ncbi:MAG TPA: NapC/NirT family cytochrome c [Methylomirabilota bacterium]|nr:NapC/NirT family cytochrome c [Methylomirabilota bacterium]